MRNRNLALILNFLHQNSPISRAELSNQLGINKASISTTVRDLIKQGIVVESGIKASNQDVGHPSIDLMINPDAGRVIGVDVNPELIVAVVTDISPKILWREETIVQNFDNIEEYFSQLKLIINRACEVARSYQLPIMGLGLGLPGLLDIENNILLAAYDLGWENIDLNPLMEGNEDIPFFTGNEAHIAALGESYFGSSKKSRSALYLHWGYELSGGIIINENVVPGELGLAGEIGHFSLDPQGASCTCGNFGCWNSLVNQCSIIDRIKIRLSKGEKSTLNSYRASIKEDLSFTEVILAGQQADPLVLSVLKDTAKWMGIGIANFINVLNPEYVILGGPISVFFEIVYPIIQAEIDQRSLPWQRAACQVKPAFYGQDACLVGTVATIIWNILNKPDQGMKRLRSA